MFVNIREIFDLSLKNKSDIQLWVQLIKNVLERFDILNTPVWREVVKLKIASRKLTIVLAMLEQSNWEQWSFEFFATQLQN